MDLWFPGGSSAPVRSLPTLSFVGGPFRGVLHTTEGSSYAGALGAYTASGNGPHFTVTFETGAFKVYQHVSLNQASTALMHPSNTIDTNRLSAIQIEIVGTAADAPSFSDAYLQGLAGLMRWVEEQTGIQRTAPRFEPYPQSGGLNNGVRFSDAMWASFNGWCGHQHVPHNDHGDPGAINITALLVADQPQVQVKPMYGSL